MAGLKRRDFLNQVPELARMQVPPELRDFEIVGPWGPLVKLHFGDPTVHYEVWLSRRDGELEVGLHFEGAAEDNARHLDHIKSNLSEITGELGNEVVAEEWTRHWTRLHEIMPIGELDEELLMEVSSRLAQYVRVLQPLLNE